MLGILDVAIARKLIALVAVLAPALAVALSGDGGVAAIRLADAPGGEHEIDAGSTFSTPLVWCSMPRACRRKLVFAWPHHSAARMIFSVGMPVIRSAQSRSYPRPRVGGFLESARVVGDELVIEPVVLDQLVQDRAVERGVAARPDRQVKIGRARNRRQPRIDDDELRAVVARLPEPVSECRETSR